MHRISLASFFSIVCLTVYSTETEGCWRHRHCYQSRSECGCCCQPFQLGGSDGPVPLLRFRAMPKTPTFGNVEVPPKSWSDAVLSPTQDATDPSYIFTFTLEAPVGSLVVGEIEWTQFPAYWKQPDIHKNLFVDKIQLPIGYGRAAKMRFYNFGEQKVTIKYTVAIPL